MSWPLSQDYNEAIQSPAANFSDPELWQGQVVTNSLGIPLPYSGSFADVYQLRCPGGDFAVKCFTREVPGLCERYAAIGEHLRCAALPFTVDFRFLPEGIRVRGQWYPVVKMRWVEGLLLNQFVRDSLDKPARLVALADIWARMARRLRGSSVAHGDLQHGNVILTPERGGASHAVRLVDYDGMWVTALAGQKSGEVGHPNYQHSQRLREGLYGPEVDRFPLLVIYCAVRGLLAGGRALWERYDNGDNLLFREDDLRSPRDSRLVWELARLNDPELRLLVNSLSRSAYKPLDQVPHLSDLLAGQQTPTAPADGGTPARKVIPVAVPLAPSAAREHPSPPEPAPVAVLPAASVVCEGPPRGGRPTRPVASRRLLLWLIPLALGGVALVGVGILILVLALHLSTRKRPPAEPDVALNAEVVNATEVRAGPKAPAPEPGPAPAAASSDDGIPEAKLRQLKDATVYVKVYGKEADATGSGFLIRVDGDAGLVVTNHHVIGAKPGRFTPERIELVFRSGTAREQVAPAQVVASDPDQDLAVLRVTAGGLPAPLDLKQTPKLRETMTVYTFGFPLGEDLARGRPNPAVTIGRATISSLREDRHGRLQRVQLDGEVNPGNSGGPVVDAGGRLFGIVVSKIVGTSISFAIPPAELTDLLKGRAASVVIRGLRVGDGAAEVDVEVPLLDPLHKLQAVELRHARQDALREMPRPDRDGNWSDLPGAERVTLRMAGGKAVARLTLRGPKRPLPWFFQTAYTRTDGKSFATQPVAYEINLAAAGVTRPGARASRPWQTFTSAEGGFTVDMPARPQLSKSSSHTIAGRPVKSLLVGCDTDDGVYLVLRIDLPVAVPKNVEKEILDEQRDYLARLWQGRVTREKQVLARGSQGRDFTIEGRPDGRRPSIIRAREYLIGKTIFVVAVVSRPGGEVPEGAGRFLGSLAIGEDRTRATGTPEPEPTGTELAGWGLAINPDRDCAITPGPGGLAITVPAAMHDLGGALRKFNAPRVLREVDGDFAVTVKVTSDFRPGAASTNPRSVPYLAAGLLIWSDSDNFIRLERAALRRGPRVFAQIAFLEQEGGYGGAVHNVGYRDGPCYLRLERRGSRIFGAVSDNGTAWGQLKPIDTVWPSKLKVGLVAISTSNEPFTVKFEQFDVKQGR
jgi:S1-C subfamily serine protease/regulation of enolase protein 1 (concanavalin A-like superfamily)